MHQKTLVFYSSSDSAQGGAEICLAKIVRHFRQRGFRVILVLPTRAAVDSNGGIETLLADQGIFITRLPIVRVKRNYSFTYLIQYIGNFVFQVWCLFWLLLRHNANLVHANDLTDYPPLVAARLARVPCVLHVRILFTEPKIVRWLIYGFGYWLANHIVCVSAAVAAVYNGTLQKVRVIYDGGPGPEFLDYRESVNSFRVEADIGQEEFVVGLVSRFIEDKGQIVLIEAARRLYESGCKEIRYVLVGGPVREHEDYYRTVERAVAEYGLSHKVILTGFRGDVARIMAACNVICHLPAPFYQEPFPGVVLEAMALGKCVVAARSGGIPEQLDDTCGYIVPAGDVEAIADTIKRLATSPSLAEAIGKHGRERLKRHFTLSKHFEELEKLYADLGI